MIAGKAEPFIATHAFKPGTPVETASRDGHAYPKIGDLFATAYVAVTFVILMYSALFGIYPILLLYAMWLPRIYYKGQLILRPSKDVFWLALYGAYCLLSVVWSDSRLGTLRAALEFLSMLACVVIIARTVATKSLIKGIIIGAVLALAPVYATGTFSFNGLLGSKNEAGFVAELGIYASLIFACSGEHRLRRILFSLGPMAFCAVTLVLSSSASSVVTLAASLIVTLAVYFVSIMPKGWRRFCLYLAGFLAIIIIVGGYSMNLQEVLLQKLGKNSTLTGRTYLWAQGIAIGMRHFILGFGYSAFWVEGRPEAEALWYKFGIPNKSGFHFHDLYIQVFVDLGLTGLLIICIIMMLSLSRSTNRLIKNGPELKGAFFLGLTFMLFIRAFVEVDFLQVFGLGTCLFFIVLPHLAATESWEQGGKIKTPRPAIALPKRNPAREKNA